MCFCFTKLYVHASDEAARGLVKSPVKLHLRRRTQENKLAAALPKIACSTSLSKTSKGTAVVSHIKRGYLLKLVHSVLSCFCKLIINNFSSKTITSQCPRRFHVSKLASKILQ